MICSPKCWSMTPMPSIWCARLPVRLSAIRLRSCRLSPAWAARTSPSTPSWAKAAFARLGAGGEYPNHSDYVVFDEDSFPTGVALHCQVAWDFLNGENN